MIKRISKLLNTRTLTQQKHRFSSPKEGEQDHIVTQQQAIQAAQVQVQLKEGQQAGEAQGVQQVNSEGKPQERRSNFQRKQYDQNSWDDIKLLESNWHDRAKLINTPYYDFSQNPFLEIQVNKKLDQFQQLYNLDIRHLQNVKILSQRQMDVRAQIYNSGYQYRKYLSNDISQNTCIGHSLMTNFRFKQLVETKNIPVLKQLYRNDQFRFFNISQDIVKILVDQVIESDFELQFFINFFEFYRVNEKNPLLAVTKNIDKVLQNIHNLDEVNKLKFFWKIYSSFEKSHQLINHSAIGHELTKIRLEGFDSQVIGQHLRNIYSAVLGKDAMRKLINFSLKKYSHNFEEFIKFWGLFNILISRLNSCNDLSLSNASGLNSIFKLFQMNLQSPKQILSQTIPEILFQTKNKFLFEAYRIHAKHWFQKKPDSHLSMQVGIFDEFINKKIQLEEGITITYNPWKFQNFVPIKSYLRTSKNNQIKKEDEILSQTKMIEHLIKGDYNFVLNHFLLVYSSGVQRTNYDALRSIINQAKQQQFTDQNARALYILKNINQKMLYLSDPVSFESSFLTKQKQIRWMKRQAQMTKARNSKREQNMLLNKRFSDDEGGYSRKRSQKQDLDDNYLDNKQRIYSKPKKYPQGGLFKKSKAQFATQKNPKDSYTQYRQIVKDLSESNTISFNLDRLTDVKSFKEQVQRKSRQLNQKNHKSLLNQNLPIVGSGTNLMKYLFLKKSQQQVPKINQNLRKKLKVSFISQIGALQKDFSQYLQNCRFDFALDDQIYLALLQDQKTDYVRKSFKTIVTHLVAYKPSLSDSEVQLICQICKKNRIGITLIQIYNLLIQTRTIISKESIYRVVDTLQKFKKINNDLFLLTKKYCQLLQIPFQIKMLSSYIKNLLIQEQDQRLSQLCDMIKTELKPKPYKLQQHLTAQQNIKLQKQYKQYQKKQYNKILFDIIDVVVLNVNNKLPQFISVLFDQYEKTKTQLNPNQIAISLIVYCNNAEKFFDIIRILKEQPQNIILLTFQCAIKALRLNSKALEGHSEEIFNVTLFTHNFILDEDLIQKSVQIFKFLPTSTVFIKFLEYVLRYNPPVNYQIKNGMYFVMNSINDDFAKNTISGLLDFIFNNNRQKQREEYRKARIAEQQKNRLLKEIENKNVLIDFDLQGKQIEKQIKASQTVKQQDIKKTKKAKTDKAQKTDKTQKSDKDLKVAKTEKTPEKAQVSKADKKKLNVQSQQSIILEQSSVQFGLKKSNLKKKLRNRSFNDFEQMFTKKEQSLDEVDIQAAKASGRGGNKAATQKKQPDSKKDAKKKK